MIKIADFALRPVPALIPIPDYAVTAQLTHFTSSDKLKLVDQFPTIYRIATGLYRHLIFPLRGGIEARGMEQVPTEGGMILASIHMSSLDPPALAATLKKRRLRALAKEELWKNKLFGKIVEGIGAFPVKRGAGDTESIRKCIALLKGGEAVIVFPEGHRNDGLTMNPMQPGVAMLARKSGALVVPAGICGTQKSAVSKHVKVLYGKPLSYEAIAADCVNDREAREKFLSVLAEAIRQLCSEAGVTFTSAPSGTHLQPSDSPLPTAEAPKA